MANANHTTDLYQAVTDKIVTALEAGAMPWEMPWRASREPAMPHNPISGTRYRGINPLLLWMAELDHGFSGARWATYKQVESAGGQVRKGERGETVVFWSWTESDELDDNGKPQRRAILKRYTVFNLDQVDGLDHLRQPTPASVWEPIDRADALMHATGANIAHGGSKAFYRSTADDVHLPPRESFNAATGYYTTALHELAHWTGHRSRLDRSLGNRFGSEAYAVEELIAEMGCAYTCAALGIEATTQHAGYLAAWVRVLKSDKRAIFSVASAAQKAADYLLQFDPAAAPLAAAA